MIVKHCKLGQKVTFLAKEQRGSFAGLELILYFVFMKHIITGSCPSLVCMGVHCGCDDDVHVFRTLKEHLIN